MGKIKRVLWSVALIGFAIVCVVGISRLLFLAVGP